MEWLNNPWISGIGGSIISGIIVAWITQKIFSNKEAKEQSQRLTAANREIVYAVRGGIPEGKVPSVEVVEALTSATARRYGVNAKELYGPDELAADLVKEVMDSNFISAEVKEGYCEKLLTLRLPEKPSGRSGLSGALPGTLDGKRAQFSWLMGLTLGVVTAGTTGAALIASRKDGTELPISQLPAFLIPAAIAVGAALAAASLSMILERRRSEARKRYLSSMLLNSGDGVLPLKNEDQSEAKEADQSTHRDT
ncbi:hypothetical protein [Mesorhizobium sp. M7A.F.Ca.MR.148.00.0.0]|uniref:hypothetical protein n=1 Tax=Mesorhizobium sp. M7A.F.Ca.MR.148.00.0.0 TaxID=2496775 RepID=UPI000FCB80D5|nr:hypothetical protein [Mesorhizobium sp. M7A.F.Ca.MR.148.00.0.0]RUV37445.1 hypothetical protein EOB49_11845 [Mesorhizobium sp. M7A.F.Ca.MR.148.00.0.0]